MEVLSLNGFALPFFNPPRHSAGKRSFFFVFAILSPILDKGDELGIFYLSICQYKGLDKSKKSLYNSNINGREKI